MKYLACLAIAALISGFSYGAAASAQAPSPALSTEAFLNTLGVNTHLGGETPSDPWNTDTTQIARQLRYAGVRIVRDWPGSAADGAKWNKLQSDWSPYGRFWTSIDEGGPRTQRASLAAAEGIYSAYPNLLCAVGGPNEEDDSYAQGQGATLPLAAAVQADLYAWAHAAGRRLPVSQMEFGAGWTAANNWQGDYNPARTGLNQPYIPGPADIAAAHTYLSNPTQTPSLVLGQIRALALLTSPGKPVAHTEVGAYRSAGLTPEQYARYLVIGALDAAAAGDAAYLIYGLQDSGPEGTYGLFTYPSGRPNPAADLLHRLTELLQSTRGEYAPGSRATFRPSPLAVAFSNPAISHLVLQKPTGDYCIVLWRESRFPDASTPVEETLHFQTTFVRVSVHSLNNPADPYTSYANCRSATVSVAPNSIVLLELAGVPPK